MGDKTRRGRINATPALLPSFCDFHRIASAKLICYFVTFLYSPRNDLHPLTLLFQTRIEANNANRQPALKATSLRSRSNHCLIIRSKLVLQAVLQRAKLSFYMYLVKSIKIYYLYLLSIYQANCPDYTCLYAPTPCQYWVLTTTPRLFYHTFYM